MLNRFPYLLLTLLVLGLLSIAAASSTHADETDDETVSGDQASNQHAHDHQHEDHGQTETIVVTATPLEHDRDELSIPVDRVERDEILENLGSSLGETLVHLPGVTTSGFAAGASRPVIRGQDAYRTEVLEDGLGTHDVSRESPDHAVPVNPLAAERVEIVRGPAVLRYGGGASAGAVNVITNRVPDKMPGDSVEGEVFGGVGLLANERDLAARVEAGHGPVAIHADGVFRRSNDYSIPNDDRPRIQSGSSVESWMGSAGAALIQEWGRICASYTRAESVYGIPEGDESVEIDMHTDRFRFEGDLFDPVAGIKEIRVRGVYSDYEHDEIAEGEIGQTYRNEEFDGRLEILHQEFAGFSGAIGVHGRHRDFRAEGEAAEFLAPTETTTAAVYIFEERPLGDSLTLETGLRVEHVRVQGLDSMDINRDLTFTPLSGALGLVAMPFDWLTLGVNGSVSQRAPSQVELLARGAHEATGTFELGNPDLDEETSFSGETRVVATHSRGRIEWTTFVTQYDDYIFAALQGIEVDEDGASPPGAGEDSLDLLLYTNRDALFWGTELSGEFDLFEFDCGVLKLDGRFDYVRARFDSNGSARNDDVPRIVPIRWGGGLAFDSENFDARVGFLRNEAQTNEGPFERKTQSFTHLNATLSYRMGLIEDLPLEWTVSARNLLDVRGRNHVSFNKDEVLLPGRNIRFGLRARF